MRTGAVDGLTEGDADLEEIVDECEDEHGENEIEPVPSEILDDGRSVGRVTLQVGRLGRVAPRLRVRVLTGAVIDDNFIIYDYDDKNAIEADDDDEDCDEDDYNNNLHIHYVQISPAIKKSKCYLYLY